MSQNVCDSVKVVEENIFCATSLHTRVHSKSRSILHLNMVRMRLVEYLTRRGGLALSTGSYRRRLALYEGRSSRFDDACTMMNVPPSWTFRGPAHTGQVRRLEVLVPVADLPGYRAASAACDRQYNGETTHVTTPPNRNRLAPRCSCPSFPLRVRNLTVMSRTGNRQNDEERGQEGELGIFSRSLSVLIVVEEIASPSGPLTLKTRLQRDEHKTGTYLVPVGSGI